jgi:survival motor neuron protein
VTTTKTTTTKTTETTKKNMKNWKMDEPVDDAELGELGQATALAPPSVFPSLPPMNIVDESDCLSSTLMSWYLAGYHTGFYQAMKKNRT